MGGGGGEQCVTTGYRYYVGLHLVFCHTVDSLKKIGVGDKEVWSGSVSANTSLYLNSPNLFGGESREGGVVGGVDVCFGAPTQTVNSYLSSRLGAYVPAFRGVFALVAKHCMVAANNPYIKQWWATATRVTTGWQNGLAGLTASDGYVDMNPAHIIREALTNTSWGGLGYPESDIDDTSFLLAANILQGEGFGLSLLWARNTSIDEFISNILSHINGVYYFSHSTGKLTLKLIRGDYDVGGLKIFDTTNIIELLEFTSPSATEGINQVTVNYVDRDNNAKGVTVQDIAGIERLNGQINSKVLDFVGIPVADLAAKVAVRELSQACVPIAACTILVNRVHSELEPGDLFCFNWSPLGIENMAMRIVSVEIGGHTDNKLKIKAIRDVFNFGSSSVTTPMNTLWTSPHNDPVDAVARRVEEITYWQFVREFLGDSASVLSELDNTSTFAICFCGRPSSDALNFEMWDRNQGATDWTKRDTDSFPFIGTLSVSAVPEIQSTLHLSETFLDTNLILPNAYAYLESEIVSVVSVDDVNMTVTVNRGVLDTVPVSHSSGAKIWFCQNLYGLDRTERATSEVVEIRMLPSTSRGRLALTSATTNTLTCVGRMMRPYPPGNLKINNSRWPSSIGAAAQLDLTWSHRDRTVQTVSFNKQDESNIGPEAGVTYTLRLYGETGVLKKTVTGITTTSYSWTTEVADSGLGRLNTSVRFELEAVRSTITSFDKWNVTVVRA